MELKRVVTSFATSPLPSRHVLPFLLFLFYDWARLVRGLGLIRVKKGCPSLGKGERLVRGWGLEPR